MEFSDKKAAEVLQRGIDLGRRLAPRETITTAAVTSSVLRGSDMAASAILDAPATINGTTIWQEVAGGVAGVYYTLQFTASTSLGHVLIERSTLEVKA